MKTQEDQLDALMARIEKRLTSLESNVSHMQSKLAELHEMQDNMTGTIYEQYQQVG